VAAWLGGSYGRGEQDAVSDLDLFVVVEDAFAFPLCRRQAAKASGTTLERLAIFQQFGEITNIHENHQNAPLNGSFSAVLYRNPPVIVDWVLVPQTGAVQPSAKRLLFDRAGIKTLDPKEAGQDLAERLAEGTAFFWMMAAVTAKYIVRGNVKRTQELLAFVETIVGEIEKLAERPAANTSPEFLPNQQGQTTHLLLLCDRVEEISRPPEDNPLQTPRREVEAILNLH
jgi:hypothetical protein